VLGKVKSKIRACLCLYARRVLSYHPESSYLLCEDALSQDGVTARLRIDTRLIEPFQVQPGDLALFIGEMHNHIPTVGQLQQQMQLRARVHSCVNGLDMKLYAKALELRRRFFAGEL